jgi:hypothetical protein
VLVVLGNQALCGSERHGVATLVLGWRPNLPARPIEVDAEEQMGESRLLSVLLK